MPQVLGLHNKQGRKSHQGKKQPGKLNVCLLDMLFQAQLNNIIHFSTYLCAVFDLGVNHGWHFRQLAFVGPPQATLSMFKQGF